MSRHHTPDHPWVGFWTSVFNTSVADDDKLNRAIRLILVLCLPLLLVALVVVALLALANDLHTLGWWLMSGSGVGTVALTAKAARARRQQRSVDPAGDRASAPGASDGTGTVADADAGSDGADAGADAEDEGSG